MGEAGPAERELAELGRRSAAVLRVVVAVVASVIALAVTPANAATLCAIAALNVWSVGYSVSVIRGAGTWLLVADTAAVALACATERWTVPPEVLHGTGSWVFGVVSVAVAAWQWHSTARAGGIATAAVVLVVVPGAPVFALWLGIEALLARGLYHLVRTGAGETDRIIARTEQVRQDAAVAAARRADEREHLAAVHDTAATTLLAIGTGSVDGREPWLAGQLAAALDDVTAGAVEVAVSRGQADLVPLLDEVVRRGPVTVDLSATGPVPLPAPAAAAICRAVGEALRNVTRHAGVATASVLVEQRAGTVLVEVVDSGRGFDPESVSPHRRGISSSLVDRMTAAGGRADVLSRVGGGTRVRLVWPDE